MQTGLAAAQRCLVGDIVMDKGGGLKMLDRGRRADGGVEVSAHRLAGKHADKGAVTLARICRKASQRCVKIGFDVGVIGFVGKERHQMPVDFFKVSVEETGERARHAKSGSFA